MMKLNKPNVRSVIGKDRMCRMGLTNTFKIPNTIAAQNAIHTPPTVNPGMK